MKTIFLVLLILAAGVGYAQDRHRFSLGQHEFLVDGKPFQIISGEMHPAGIPREYWLHRIRMAKAMGCNAIAVYVFWNYQEVAPDRWDFRSGNHDIAAFIRLCQTEGMWVLLRPGPYVCAEWDWGGLPTWLLKIPDIRIRCMDPRYMAAVRKYIARLSQEIVPLQCDHGGPILMVQVENEYGSYGNDRNYVAAVHRLWQENGVTVPFYTADGPTDFMLEAGSLDSCAIGLDSGGGDADFAVASKHNPHVPAFSSETYPGWLTHWKEKWQHPDTADIMNEVRYLLSHHRSFNLYVVHGGTNFGFTAGANAFSPTQFQPDVTSYDYDAPINEQGRPTPKYYALRKLIASYSDHPLPPVPEPVPVMEIPPVEMVPVRSLWEDLPKPVRTVMPRPMEDFGQSSGLILYRTKLIGHKSGSLKITEPHDFALVFLNGKLIDTVYRDGGHWTVMLPETGVKEPVLDILVEAMGHINFAQYMIDRKGITDRVTLDGMTLMNWETFTLPLDEGFVKGLKGPFANDAALEGNAVLRVERPGVFFKGGFELDSVADTYIDLSSFRKGVVWVNGHNLGRYWNVGPQLRLYCPASWLKKGMNEVRVLDLLKTNEGNIRGVKTLERDGDGVASMGREDGSNGSGGMDGSGGEAVKVTAVDRPDIGKTNSYYVSNRAPLAPLNFIKLPVGAVEPGGWIRKYLELQRDGLTGHLGEISAWLDKKDNAWYSGTGQGSHGWEEVPYWLKGYGDLAYLLRDSGMIATTRDWLEKVLRSQRSDGYYGPRVVENPAKDTIPDLWPNMLMLWCMQSYYEYSSDPRVLTFMNRYFRWELRVPEGQLLRTYWENSRGGDNLYSIYWLYNHTGEGWLLDLAAKIHRCTANWEQDTTLPNWHNVNVAQCFREPATYYMQTKDSADLRSTYTDFGLMRQLYGQVPGGMFGADEDARKGYSDPRQAVETCGMVEQMSSDELLMGITGDPTWGDNCEDVAFNTYPAAVLPDFRGLRYLTAPNMVVSDDKNHSPGIENSGPFLLMNPFSSRCCQHNHSQGWPYYAEHLWMATPDNGVAGLLYGECVVKARVGAWAAGGSGDGGVVVTIAETTHYPFDSTVRMRVGVDRPSRFPVYLRIPGWCASARVRVNGVDIDARLSPDGYAKIRKTWVDGDEVELILPMGVRVRTWVANKNSVSVSYGPLSFSLKIKEDYVKVDSKASAIGDSKWQAGADQSKWPAFEILPGSAWNYGLEVGGSRVGGGSGEVAANFEVVHRPWPTDDFPWTQGAAPVEIRAKGRQIPQWTVDQYGLCGVLPQSPVAVSTPEQPLELVPMGAARLRISSFPVVVR